MSATKVVQFEYDKFLESALSRISVLLKGHYGVSRRTVGLLLLQGDTEVGSQVKKQESPADHHNGFELSAKVH